MPKFPDPEQLLNPLSNRERQGSGMRLGVDGLVTQDVIDARIAHLLSGGYSWH